MRKNFKNFGEYEQYSDKCEDGIPYNMVCFVGRENEKSNVCWDGEFDTKSVKVALNRFFKACPELNREDLEGLENIVEKDEGNRFFFSIEQVSDNVIYIAFGTNHPEFWTK